MAQLNFPAYFTLLTYVIHSKWSTGPKHPFTLPYVSNLEIHDCSHKHKMKL